MWPPFCLTTSCKWTLAFVTTFRHKSSASARHNFTMWALSCATFSGLLWRPENSDVVPRAFWRLVSKSCDECKGSFARGCEAKWWSHWTCSSLGTIFQSMRILYQVSNVFVIIKMCYVHNQWYDISCATLYD